MAKSTWMLIGFGVSIFSAYLLFKNQQQDPSGGLKHVWPAGGFFQSDIRVQEKEVKTEASVKKKVDVKNATEKNVTKTTDSLKDATTKNDTKNASVVSEDTKQKQDEITLETRNLVEDSEIPGSKANQLDPQHTDHSEKTADKNEEFPNDEATGRRDEPAGLDANDLKSSKPSEAIPLAQDEFTEPHMEDIVDNFDNRQSDQMENQPNIYADVKEQSSDDYFPEYDDFQDAAGEFDDLRTPEEPYTGDYTDYDYDTNDEYDENYGKNNLDENYDGNYDENYQDNVYGDEEYDVDVTYGEGSYDENDQYEPDTLGDYANDEFAGDGYEYNDEKREIDNNYSSGIDNEDHHDDSVNQPEEDKIF